MNRWNAKLIWGYGLILFGLALTARELGLISFRIFFPGWWTFFIIIPCTKSIIQRTNSIITNIGLGLGLLLLLSAQGFASWDIFGTLFVAIIFLIVGISLLFKKPKAYNDRMQYSKNVKTNTVYDDVHAKENHYKKEDINYENNYKKEDINDSEFNKENVTNNNQEHDRVDRENQDKHQEQNRTNNTYHSGSNYTALFSANNYQYVNEEFRGATISSILGNVQIDLRNAIIDSDSVINVTCILGGIDIYVPSNVRIINQCTAILAGVDANVMSPRNMTENSYTIYIKGNCLLGGIEIK